MNPLTVEPYRAKPEAAKAGPGNSPQSSEPGRPGRRKWPPESPGFGQSSGPCLSVLGPAP